jgi:hypothetical protein
MNKKQFAAIGIELMEGTHEQWMDRLFHAKRRLEKMIDPLPGNRRKTPTAEDYLAIVGDREDREEELRDKGERLHYFLNELIDSSVRFLRKDILDRYMGNVAIDGTKIRMQGQAGVSRKILDAILADDQEQAKLLADADVDAKWEAERQLEREEAEAAGTVAPLKRKPSINWKSPIRTINYDAGMWGRGESHDGEEAGSTHRAFALEAELAVMTANAPGETADFPLLAIGFHHHRPGADKLEAKRLLDSIASRNFPKKYLLVDRGFLPKALPDELQGPARAHGWLPVFDYKWLDLGKQATHKDVILVDGQWYVANMPEVLANAERDYREAVGLDNKKKKIKRMTATTRSGLRELRDERRELRVAYRLTAKGVAAPDGSQRFTYPDPATYDLYDPNTGEELPKQQKRTITIPQAAGLKYKQPFAHRESKWHRWYGLRSTVEGFNSYVKDNSPTNIEDGSKRRARGNTFAAVVAALVVVHANIRKIETFIFGLAREGATTSKNRHALFTPIDEEILDEHAASAISAAVSALDEDPPPKTE